MKKATILFLLLCTTIGVNAQDVGAKTLISQSRTTTANIGKADITIKYHSPSVNGRKIFGGIVPFDFEMDGVEYPWRAGSNQRTTIEFASDVEVEGNPLPAGTYGFVVLVSKKEWTLIFSSGKSWGAFNYKKENDVLRIPVKVRKTPFQEWLSYDFLNPKSESVEIQLRWEESAVQFNVKTNALENILAQLNSKEDKSSADYQDLAVRTLEKDPKATDQAMAHLEKANELLAEIESEPLKQAYDFNIKILKSEILESLGKKQEAKALKDEAFASASGFNIYYYALEKYTVDGEKKEAFKVLMDQVEKNPDNYQNHFALGEYYLKEKNQKKATEHFKKAYDMTVEQESGWVNYARYLYVQNKLALENK